jgi:hypothetical protein
MDAMIRHQIALNIKVAQAAGLKFNQGADSLTRNHTLIDASWMKAR